MLLDLRIEKKRTAAAKVVGKWFDRCAADGHRATEPDNLDSWTRSRRLLNERHTIGYARLLVKRAYQAGLAITRKNTPSCRPDQIPIVLRDRDVVRPNSKSHYFSSLLTGTPAIRTTVISPPSSAPAPSLVSKEKPAEPCPR